AADGPGRRVEIVCREEDNGGVFYESVPLWFDLSGSGPTANTLGGVLDQYGIDRSRLSSILSLPENGSVRPALGSSPGPHTTLPSGNLFLRLPIDVGIRVVESRPIVDMVRGLRPTPTGAGPSPWTHGVRVAVTRDGAPCPRIRWLQTAVRDERPSGGLLERFVDGGGSGVPWYFLGSNPLTFTDTPCGPEAPAAGKGLTF